jgi:transposase-like protein
MRRYETAWAMLHKLRRAMVAPDRELLKDRVEVDETYIGGPEAGLRGGRQVVDKAIVVGAVEVRGRASGRVRLKVIQDISARTLVRFVTENVAPGAVVLTDGFGSYDPLPTMGYRHRARVQGTDPRMAARILPRIHRVFGNLETWLAAPTMASATLTYRPTSTSSPSASTAGAPRWPPSRPSWASEAFTSPRPTTSCIEWSQTDKHKP